ncbi:UNVERIFIED_CONTAM: hypothetical protein FKN15_006135 [Acipenser sinensis]
MIPFDRIAVLEGSITFKDVAIGKLHELKETIKNTTDQIKESATDFDMATHGLGFQMLDVYSSVLQKCADSQIEKLQNV